MFLNVIFLVSGLIIAALIGAKIIEGRSKRKPLILRLVSLGDERVRNWSHGFAHYYSEIKERADFFIKKQLPLHTKNLFNKTKVVIREEAMKRVGDIRGSKFLKKSDGISEFFKNISEKENGGRIDNDLSETQGSHLDEKRLE